MLFMAYLMLLGHDVVPHHNHRDTICTNHLCGAHVHRDDIPPIEADHKEEGEDPNCCEAIRHIVLSRNEMKQEMYTSDAGSILAGWYIHIFYISGNPLLCPIAVPANDVSVGGQSLICFIEASGLRGPPALLKNHSVI